MDGIIVLDKPEGCTSHDAVNRVRRIAGTRRVGHLGTLDPLATGVLPLVVGRCTRLAQFYTHNDKRYVALIRFGFSTSTYDRDGRPTSPITQPVLSSAQVEKLMEPFRGEIMQAPPPVSAKKVAGVPAYRLARRQQAVELPPAKITIYEFELLSCAGAEIEVRIHCSAGAYLRSIAHDMGQALGCGAHLQTLRRTASGDFDLSHARTVDELESLARQQHLGEALIRPADLLPQFPNEFVDSLTAGQIRQGRDFRVSPFHSRSGSKYVKAIDQQGELIAIGEARLPNLYHPVLVL